MYLVVIHVSYPRQNLSPRFRLYGSRTRQPARQGTRQEGPGEDPGHGQPTDAVGQRTKRHVCGPAPWKRHSAVAGRAGRAATVPSADDPPTAKEPHFVCGLLLGNKDLLIFAYSSLGV